MALTKVTRSGITDDSINAAKIEDGTIVDADITPGTITPAKLASTLDLSSKTVTLPNTSVTNAMLAGSIANDKLANSSITINGAATALGGSVNASSLAWQSVKTADFNAVAGEGYFVDTNSVGAVTATLPGSPSAGDTIAFKDYAGTFGTNSLTIARNGNNIQGVANNSEIKTNRASIVLVYIDATKGWLFTNESNVADLEKTVFTSATGGTITTSGDYKIHSFTGDGNFVIASVGGNTCGAGNPNAFDIAVVAGGGGGSTGPSSGGGGGGGVILAPAQTTLTAGTYPVTVGAGGAGGGANPNPGCAKRGYVGSDTILSVYFAKGGGAGGNSSGPVQNAISGQELNGGSGGGSRGEGSSGTGCAGTSNQVPSMPAPLGPLGFGNRGGYGTNEPGSPWNSIPLRRVAGGGGGAGGVGGNADPSGGGNGGAGKDIAPVFGASPQSFYPAVSGTTSVFAGGGGGSCCTGGGGTGPGVGGDAGPGGGGVGANAGPATPQTAGAGTANHGGGGGAGQDSGGSASGAGGKGIVLIKYKFQ